MLCCRRLHPCGLGAFLLPGTRVMDADDVQRALARIAHEIVERNQGIDGWCSSASRPAGVPLARRLAAS